MNTSFGSIAVVTLVASSAFAQAWDPVKQATGWARVDKDGSIAFYDPASRRIYSWMREGGILGSVDVSKLADEAGSQMKGSQQATDDLAANVRSIASTSLEQSLRKETQPRRVAKEARGACSAAMGRVSREKDPW